MKSPVFKAVVQVFAVALPWPIRRFLLKNLLGFSIDPKASIGLSIVLADKVSMAGNARIGHFNYIGRLDFLSMADQSGIASHNWITGLAKSMNSHYFRRWKNRRSDLILGTGAWITTRHIVDCSDAVELGDFACIAGVRSQLLTHGPDFMTAEVACAPISLGAYTVLATGSIVLKGVTVADRCVISAGSVVTSSFEEPYSLIVGNPATFARKLPESSKLFHRTQASLI